MTPTFTPVRTPETQPSLDAITVAEAMHPGVITCAPDAPLATVARTMAAHRIHSVVVALDPEHGAWGIISDADVVAAVDDHDLERRTAREFAATGRITIRSDETLAAAARLLHESGDSHLIVLDRRARPAGVLSTLDVVDALVALE